MTSIEENERLLLQNYKTFSTRVEERLAAGAREYRGTSHAKSPASLVEEIQQELEDVCGWGALLWMRLETLRKRAEELGR